MKHINYKLGFVVLIAVILLVGTVSAAVLTTSQFGALAQNASGYVDGNPIGGGKGYSDIKTSGDCTATTSATLISCLGSVTSGQVVYIPGTSEINMTDVSPTVDDTTTIPTGVTIASNRGYGGSAGGRIFKLGETSDNGYIMFTTGGNNVRITGLRLDADHTTNATWVREKVAISNEYAGFQIDNCEIFGWSVAGILIDSSNSTLVTAALATTEIGSSMANIHHNFIHNNLAGGYGYGIANDRGSSLIKGNAFAKNRHSTQSTGVLGSGYEATYNIHIAGETGNWGHIFDVHGSPHDGCNAGSAYRIQYNTVLSNLVQDVMIGGDPLQHTTISNNVFLNNTISYSGANVSVASRGITNNITMKNNIIDGVYVQGSYEEHYEGYTC